MRKLSCKIGLDNIFVLFLLFYYGIMKVPVAALSHFNGAGGFL